MLRAGPAAVAGVVAVGLAVHHHLHLGGDGVAQGEGGAPRPAGRVSTGGGGNEEGEGGQGQYSRFTGCFFTGPPKIWLSPDPFMKSHTPTFFSWI